MLFIRKVVINTNRTYCLFFDYEYSTDYPHPRYVCREIVKTNDGTQPICGQFIPNELRINDLSTAGKYIVFLRRDLFQELIILPEEHIDNEKFVISVDIWRRIIELHGSLDFRVQVILPKVISPKVNLPKDNSPKIISPKVSFHRQGYFTENHIAESHITEKSYRRWETLVEHVGLFKIIKELQNEQHQIEGRIESIFRGVS